MEIKNIYDKVKDYLCDEIGNMALPGEPKFDAELKNWHVPVLCKTEKGIFLTGEILLDEDLNFIRIPAKEQMLKILETAMRLVPFLVYAEPEELKKKGLKAVAI
ncbi:MAG TPA: hypothetical protein ENN22_05080 [bacterium]|nr:hypothetical protein [bacterium]